jgi:inosine/xanthosine triphosphate pyrophosphatase family protein
MPTLHLSLATHNDGKTREMQAWLDALIKKQNFNDPNNSLHPFIVCNIKHLPPCPEPHDTFLENAIAKAKYAARYTAQLSLADDSGLCIPLLYNAPGVVSARFSEFFPEFIEKHFPEQAAKLLHEDLSFTNFKSLNLKTQDIYQYIVASDDAHQHHIYYLIQVLLFLLYQQGQQISQPSLKISNTLDILEFKTPAYYQTSLVLAAPDSPDLYVAQARWDVEFRIKGCQKPMPNGAGFGYDSHIYIPDLNCYVCELSLEEKNKISHRGQALQQMEKLLLAYATKYAMLI